MKYISKFQTLEKKIVIMKIKKKKVSYSLQFLITTNKNGNITNGANQFLDTY